MPSVYIKKAKPFVKNPPDDYPAIAKRLREETASNQRWHRIDRQLDRMDHRIDRLDRPTSSAVDVVATRSGRRSIGGVDLLR